MSTLFAAATVPRLGWADAGAPSYLACAKDTDDSFALYGLTDLGARTFRIPLPARGHAGAGHPTRAEAVVFARRPGSYALVIDCARGTVRHQLTPPDGRQFNGHGAFLQDGAVLATSEQMADTSDGRIGLWDVNAGYVRMAEVATQGLGPHDMRLLPDGQTLVLANGGIATDATDRTKLNIPEMRPNLVYLDVDEGITEMVELDPALHQNSIRHLAVRADGLAAFAMQWEGDPTILTPLLGLHRQGDSPILATTPNDEALSMQGYAGSVAFCGDGTEVAITSPKGGKVQRFDATGVFLGAVTRADVCGVAAMADGLLTSDGLGALLAIRAGQAMPLARHNCAWDNHIVTI